MRRRIVLVEDEPNIIEAISFILSRAGWDVTAHANGETALDTIRRIGPDAVLLDVMLPGRSGYDILRDLRADAVFAPLPVLMLTARGQKKDRELAGSLGVTRFMTKPFSNSELLVALDEITEEITEEITDGTTAGTTDGTTAGIKPGVTDRVTDGLSGEPPADEA